MPTTQPTRPVTPVKVNRVAAEQPPPIPPHVPSTSLAQTFGLHPPAAVLAVMVDLLVFGSDTLSGELLLPVGVAVAAVLGFIVYRMQRRWYGDNHDAALIKALTVGLLTAIPVPLTPLLAIPTGVIGVAKALFSNKK